MKCSNYKLFKTCRQIRTATRKHFLWSFHNLFAHPFSEIVFLLGFEKLSNEIHDKSIPEHTIGEGRG